MPRRAKQTIRVGWRLIVCAIMGASSASAEDEAGPNAQGITEPSIATSLPANGDPGGSREALAKRGVTYNVYYTNDVLANVRGGLKTGTIDQGKLEGSVTVDLEKARGLKGLSFFANGFWITNTGRIRRDYVGGLNTIAAIEAVPTVRLSELWLEQKIFDDKASVRIGQLAADVEFFYSGLSFMFLQSDWATITAANLPSGGPAYPLSTPGVRFKYEPSKNLAMLVAVFNGDPAGPGEGDEQLRNHHGLNFRVQDPPLIMGEVQLKANTGDKDAGLARTWKIGGWNRLGTFQDTIFADDGKLLSDPTGSGNPARHRQNVGVYGIVEQQLYRPQGGAADSGVSVFSRISASPSDRKLISFFVDGGIVVANLLPQRPHDKFGASFTYARFSDRAAAHLDLSDPAGASKPARDFEANLELTYVAQIVPGWTVQPVATYVWHPNGEPGRDATVVGVRSYMHY